MRDVLADENLVHRIQRANVFSLIALVAGSWYLFSLQAAVGVLLGGLISVTSFQVLKWQLTKAFQSGGSVPGKGGLFATYYLRFLGVVFIIFTVIYYGWVHPLALLLGLSVVVISIISVGMQELVLMLFKGER